MSRLRVLHIVPWFPHPANEIEGVFILEHITSLKAHCYNEILHIQFGNKKEEFTTEIGGIKVNRMRLKPLVDKWKFKEVASQRFIKKFIAKNASQFDLVNFHIAYPNGVGIGSLKKKFPSLKFAIIEHWSAYHENFNLPEGSRGRKRIENIFTHQVPLITVSNALKEDIEQFTRTPQKNAYILPNIIDTGLFSYRKREKNEFFTFVSINNWNPMKNPFVLIDAFAALHQNEPATRLILGGSGSLIPLMEERVKELNLNEAITFNNRLSKQEVAMLLGRADAYVQSSNYETFSVICAEALACGVPVIATKIGGMLDFISAENGILVDDLTVKNWITAMEEMMNKGEDFDSEKIALTSAARFNKEKIGLQYFDILKQIKDAR